MHSRWKMFYLSKAYYLITSKLEVSAAYSNKYWFLSQPAVRLAGVVKLGWAWLSSALSCVLELGLLHGSLILLRTVAYLRHLLTGRCARGQAHDRSQCTSLICAMYANVSLAYLNKPMVKRQNSLPIMRSEQGDAH